jgi:formiminoglutamate deiminase
MTAFHCDAAWIDGGIQAATIGVHDGRITTVEAQGLPPHDATRLHGLVIPGLANAHSHAFRRALRGRTHGGEAGSFWGWRDHMYAVANRLTPDLYHALARATYAEMVMAGITAVGEFHYLHHQSGGQPYDDPNAMSEALVAAAADAGIRLTLLDTCYLHAGFGLAADGVQERFSDLDAMKWMARVEGYQPKDVVMGAAIHSVRAVDVDSARVVAMWARDKPLHFHLSEQPAENETCRDATGLTPTELLTEAGAVGPMSTAVHATHLTEGDMMLLGTANAYTCFCPTTER